MARILYVESCAVKAERLCALLEPKGHTVHVVNCAERAMMRLEAEGPYELLVLGVFLRGMDGAELCRWIEKWSSVKGVRKLAFTWAGSSLPADLHSGLPRWLPVDRYLDGVQQPEDLIGAVEEMLSTPRREAPR